MTRRRPGPSHLVESTLNDKRPVLGLLGGICAGKSFVARRISEIAPASVVDADRLAGRALAACARDGRLQSALGEGVLLDDGAPDRAAIARRVFHDPVALAALEGVIHPEVRARIEERLEDHAAGRGERLLVLDVPLLLESGLDRRCEALWFVETPDALRRERAAQRGLSLDDQARREDRQAPLDKKRDLSTYVIRGDEPLDRQIRTGLRTLGLPTSTCT